MFIIHLIFDGISTPGFIREKSWRYQLSWDTSSWTGSSIRSLVDASVPVEIHRRLKPLRWSIVYLSGTSLVLEDTDDIIYQAELEALEEWRSDKAGSFENDDGCQTAEQMKCL